MLVSQENPSRRRLRPRVAVPPAGRAVQTPPVSVLIADDNPVLRLGLRALFDGDPRICVAGESGDGAQAVRSVAEFDPDVLLLNLRPPGAGALGALAELRRAGSPARTVIVAGVSDPDTVIHLIAAGASGYLVHGYFGRQDLVDAVLGTAAGRAYVSPPAAAALIRYVHAQIPAAPAVGAALTRREREVLKLLADGLSNGQIADRLTISGKTVKNHVHHIYKRLNVLSRDDAVALWPLVREDGTESPGH
ncbi:MAG: hypothetical protein QOJ50_1647 [Cryptosporangiaceae bacterium]|nr:hypothetical protein [Cryptosporangiaceae bacterium]